MMRDTSDFFLDVRDGQNSGAGRFPNSIEQIQKRELVGLIISDFLSKDELLKALGCIDNAGPELRHEVRTGYTFPIAYFEADELSRRQGVGIDAAFRNWKKDRSMFPSVFGMDMEIRLKETLSELAGGRDVVVLEGSERDTSYTPATLPVFYPNMGGIPIRCGSMFDRMLPNLYADLNDRVHIKKQLSYFVVLQMPDCGGELRIFDLEWREIQRVISETDVEPEDDRTVSSEGKDSLRSSTVRLVPGDLRVFAAGEIWLVVDPPSDDVSKVTVGGFMGFT